MSTQQQRVLLLALADARNDSCLAFVTGCLRLQTILMQMNVTVSIVFQNDEKTVLRSFVTSNDHDQFICIRTSTGFSPEMVVRMIQSADKDFIIGSHPLPKMDWEKFERVMGKKTADEEVTEADVKNAGLTFNADPLEPADADGFVRVNPDTIRDMAAYKITKRVASGDAATRDARPPFGWTGPIYMDAKHPCTAFGPMDYIGCIGLRQTIR